jgi:NAD(P)-dependent dehydrogenase (short-subunit alcohol dehydrogenase family)
VEAQRVVLVTGSNSGFGRLTVETLARREHEVFAGVRESEGRNATAAGELHALAGAEGLRLRVVEMDVTDDASVGRAVEEAVGTAGRLDVVVNNAGNVYAGPVEAFTSEEVRRQFDVNLFGALRVGRAVLPHMRRQGSGLLVQVGSVVGRLALPYSGLYGASKFALEGLTEAWSQELAPFGIEAAIVEPGTYPTELVSKRAEPTDAARVAPYGERLGAFFGRFAEATREAGGDPQEVADAVARLVEKPFGERPLRAVVAPGGQDGGVLALNAAAEEAARDLVEAMGLAPVLAGPATSSEPAR